MKKILILCTGNSCRSQIAEGFLKSLDGDLYVRSAGTSPAVKVNDLAIQVMDEIGVDISGNTPTSVENYLAENWDYVITVCGGANENCPIFNGKVGKRLHIGFEDPDGHGIEIFRKVRDQIRSEFTKFYITEIKGFTLPKCGCQG